MARYSFAGNIMSVFTDCPGREKLSYPADYTMPMGAIHRNHELAAYLRTTMRHLVEGQSHRRHADGRQRRAEDPGLRLGLHRPVRRRDQLGQRHHPGARRCCTSSTATPQTMARYYDRMVDFADYIQRQKVGTGADAHIVDAALADWVAADQTSGRITGTWGYYMMITKLADDGAADRPRRRRGEVHGPGRRHQGGVQRPLLQHDAAPLHHRRERRHHRRHPGGAGARARRRAGARTASAAPSSTRSSSSSTPSTPTATARTSAAAPSAWRRPSGRWPPAAATTSCGTCCRRTSSPATGSSWRPPPANPGGMTTIGRALEPRRLQEPHDPRPDRGVVPRRPGRHPAGRRLDRLPVAGHPAEARR